MNINPITGYDVTRDESGERHELSSRFSLTPCTLNTNSISLPDDSETEWMYN